MNKERSCNCNKIFCNECSDENEKAFRMEIEEKYWFNLKSKNMKNKEQQIIVTTHIKFDFVERLKVLFGKVVIVKQTSYIPQEQEINMFNSVAEVSFDNTIKYFTKQNKPNFGYSPIEKVANEI